LSLITIENFIIEEIDTAYSLDELNQKECEWILKENCLKPCGYNIKPGGNQKGFLEETNKKFLNLKKERRSKVIRNRIHINKNLEK